MPRDQVRKNELRRSDSSKLFLYERYFSVELMRGFRPTSNLLQLRIRRRFFNNVMRGARSNPAKSFYERVKKKGEKAMTRCEYDIGENPWKNIVGQGHQREAVSFLLKNGVVVVLPRRLRGVFAERPRSFFPCDRLSAKS